MRLTADILLLIGGIVACLAAVGLIRMPDVYNRIQAGTKAATLGVIAVAAGVGFLHPTWWPKLLIIVLFVLFTSPVGSSAIARAARLGGLTPWRAPEADGPQSGEEDA